MIKRLISHQALEYYRFMAFSLRFLLVRWKALFTKMGNF